VILVRRLTAAAALSVFSLSSASAGSLPFDENWKEQGFLRPWSNDYIFQEDKLDVVSDGTVSLVWRAVDQSMADADSARWLWETRQGVEATDLTQKGGDDRNLAIYFVFVDAKTAENLTRNTARRLLRNENTRALVYVWGGKHSPGSFLASPYHPRLITRVLRESGTGRYREDVDLALDFRRAFGDAKDVLVGIGISADSDDTNGLIHASIENFELVSAQ